MRPDKARVIVVGNSGSDAMIALQLSPLNQSLPMAKCSKHPSQSIPPKLTGTAGALTCVWACPACEAEDKANTAESNIMNRGKRRMITFDDEV